MIKSLFYSVLVLFVFSSSLQAKRHEEIFSIPLPHILSQWKVGYRNNQENGSSSVRYILADETIENWSQLVNVQFKDRKFLKCYDAESAMRQETLANSGVTFKIHSKSKDDVIFEKTFPSGMHELVRMIMTQRGLHRIAYTRRDTPFSESDRSQWMERLTQATLESTTRYY